MREGERGCGGREALEAVPTTQNSDRVGVAPDACRGLKHIAISMVLGGPEL
jgi:hypothetical protein